MFRNGQVIHLQEAILLYIQFMVCIILKIYWNCLNYIFSMIRTINCMYSKMFLWKWMACLFETRRGCFQNKIHGSAFRWFYYTIYHHAGQYSFLKKKLCISLIVGFCQSVYFLSSLANVFHVWATFVFVFADKFQKLETKKGVLEACIFPVM